MYVISQSNGSIARLLGFVICRLNTSASLHGILSCLVTLSLTKVFSKTGLLTENIEINSKPY